MLAAAGLVSSLAAAAAEIEVLFESESLRIYRVLGPDGVARTFLTNLDEKGDPLLPEPAGEAVGGDRARRDDFRAADLQGAPESRRSAAPAAEPHRHEEPSTTTIVININAAPPAAPAPAVVPVVAAPYVIFGGLVGGFRYPDRQPFLGYGTGVGSPSMFGGLGLNAANGFGLKRDASCTKGFDCMFPPRP